MYRVRDAAESIAKPEALVKDREVREREAAVRIVSQTLDRYGRFAHQQGRG